MPRIAKTTTKAAIKHKAEESRRDRFERIGKARMQKTLTGIRLLGNLASANYQWSPKDVKVISDTLMLAVNDMLSKFQRREKAPPLQFDFPGEENGKKRANAH